MEKKWLEEIEQKAMNDYRSKDLGNNADITAQIFNQKRAQRNENEDEEGDESSDRARKAAQLAALEAQMQPQTSSNKNGPMVGPQIDAPSSWLKTIKAPTSGTKWHNEPGTKKWYEAKSEEGYTYYWNIETNQSIWDSPPEGYVSLREQNEPPTGNPENPEDIVSPEVAQQRAAKKAQEAFIQSKMKGKKNTGSSAGKPKKSTSKSDFASIGSQGPLAKSEPYGAWQSVPVLSTPVNSTPIDFQVPQVKEAPQANVTMHSDRLTKFEEKKTPSLGGASSSSSANKPAIVFRKRKINEDHKKNARKREDE